MTMAAPKVVLSRHEDIRDALADPALTRRFDPRSFAEGNSGDGTVSTAHGELQRARRRLENTQFRTEHLRTYERVLFPALLNEMLDDHVVDDRADLADIAPLLTVVLAAKRAGLDSDHRDVPRLRRLVRLVDAFSNGLSTGFLEMKDPQGARRRVLAALEEFDWDVVRPARNRRQERIARARVDGDIEAIVHDDILTALLVHRDDPALELDDGRIVREVATYLQGGTHSGAQTLLNTLDFLFPRLERDPSEAGRLLDDRLFVARCVHETLRLRPITPSMKRRVEVDTEIAGLRIAAGTMVVLDVETANRSPELYGPDAYAFDPDRPLRDGIPRWGLSFGFGPHQCPGRSSAVGLPVPVDFQPRDDHLYGLVPLMVQAVVRRGVRRDPDREPRLDDRSQRRAFVRFPVIFPAVRTHA
ncbi:MAG: cytochrome P450 [Chloroflexota bacterium]